MAGIYSGYGYIEQNAVTEINGSRRHGNSALTKNTRANITIGSLNMRGHRATNAGHAPSKWAQINQLLRTRRIGILALQETHLTDEMVMQLERLYEKRMKIVHSSDPQRTNTRGVAIVLNKEITASADIQVWTLIPGRALIIKYKWHANEYLTVACIYAPNDANENEKFWLDLKDKWVSESIPRPDALMGDFNIVEDSVTPVSGESLSLRGSCRAVSPTSHA